MLLLNIDEYPSHTRETKPIDGWPRYLTILTYLGANPPRAYIAMGSGDSCDLIFELRQHQKV